MKNLLFPVVTALLMGASLSAVAADVGVSVTVDQPGFYGRLDIGNVPTPQLIYAQPVLIARPPPTVVVQEPLYLHVPPGHAKHWKKHCREYNACGQPVYFVQDRWYDEVYVPARREKHRGEDHGRGEDHDHDKGHEHGKGHDNGKGHDHDR
jgi:hypothetical protein